MWLSAISKRTPQGYFTYLMLSLVLVFLPTFRQWPDNWLAAPTSLQNLAFISIPFSVLFLSFLCNRIFVISDIFSRNTLWPGHIFIAALMMHLLDGSLVATLVHGLLGILLVYELLTLHYNQDARRHSFQIGLYIGIASLFNFTIILLVPFLLLALRFLKPLNIREYILFLLAVGLPFYFVWSYSFLTDDYSFWNVHFTIQSWFSIPVETNWHTWMKWGVIVGAGGALSLYILSHYNSLSVRMRRLSTATIYLFAGCVLVAYASGLSQDVLFYMAPAFSLFGTMFMLRYSNKSTLEIIHLIFVGIIVGVILTGGQ